MCIQFFSKGDVSLDGELGLAGVGEALPASDSIRVVQAAQSHAHDPSSSTRVALISIEPEKYFLSFAKNKILNWGAFQVRNMKKAKFFK